MRPGCPRTPPSQHIKKSTLVIHNRLTTPTVVYIRHAVAAGYHLVSGPANPERQAVEGHDRRRGPRGEAHARAAEVAALRRDALRARDSHQERRPCSSRTEAVEHVSSPACEREVAPHGACTMLSRGLDRRRLAPCVRWIADRRRAGERLRARCGRGGRSPRPDRAGGGTGYEGRPSSAAT